MAQYIKIRRDRERPINLKQQLTLNSFHTEFKRKREKNQEEDFFMLALHEERDSLSSRQNGPVREKGRSRKLVWTHEIDPGSSTSLSEIFFTEKI